MSLALAETFGVQSQRSENSVGMVRAVALPNPSGTVWACVS